MNLAAHFLISQVILAYFAFVAYSKGNDKVCPIKLEEMVTQTFVSEGKYANGHTKEFQLLLSEKEIGNGANGIVYHVHPTGLVDFDGNPVGEHCVALKQFEYPWGFANEIETLKEFAKLEDEHRHYLLRPYQIGHMVTQQYSPKAFIMELGEMSLHDHFENDVDKLDAIQIRKLAKDIALAMRDFHRVAMHLDLKPRNMMYFPESGGELILKAIDFGSSQLLKYADFSSSDELGRANLSLNIGEEVGTRGYMSPEMRDKWDVNSWDYEKSAEYISDEHPFKLTPKSDIWSIGIMLYEAILSSSQTDLEIFYDMRGRNIKMVQIIYEFSYFYKFDKYKWMAKRAEDIKPHNEIHRVHAIIKSQRDYAAYVYLALKVHLEHPVLYELINSCLELVPKDRPSAVGMLEYLDDKCKLNPVSAESTPILLDHQTVQLILEYLEEGRKKSKKPKLQFEKIDRIKHFLNTANMQNGAINLRTFSNNAEQHSSHASWCDTQNSELPKFKSIATSSGARNTM